MIRTFEHTVGGKTYQITTYPASKGMRILKSLLGLFGPSIAEIFGSANVGDPTAIKPENLTIDSVAFARAAQLFVDNLDKVEVETLMKDMTDKILVGGQPLPGGFDQEFAGNYGALMSILARIVQENYASFFGEGGFANLLSLVSRAQSNVSPPSVQS